MVKLLSLLCNRKFVSVMVLVVLWGVFSVAVSAASSSIDQAKRAKIDMTIRIAAEQVNRGLYKQAEAQLGNLQTADEFVAYISERQHRAIIKLQTQITQSLQEREKITRILQQSETLAEQGDYQGSLALLAQIKDSLYASEPERKMIQDSYQQVAAKKHVEQKKWQMLYDQSASSYNSGQSDHARQGFIQVIESGYPVKGDKTPEQYILLIDTNAARATTPMPAIGVPTEPEQSLPVIPESADQDIEPIDLLELEVNRQVADSASAQAQESGSSYIHQVISKRKVQIDYTRAIVTDAIEKAQQSLDDEAFDQAMQLLRRAFSTVEKNKMLLGDVMYSDYTAQLTNLEQKVNESRQAAQELAEIEHQKDTNAMAGKIRETMDSQRIQAVEDSMDRAFAFQKEQRYEEAMGQLDHLLAIDQFNQRALIMKQTLEHTVSYIEQRRIQEEIDRQEIALLIKTQEKSTPFSEEMNFPRNWKEISERRDAAIKDAGSPIDAAINELLDKTVDLSILTEDTTLEEAISILQDSVSPLALPIVVRWPDLRDNASIEKDTLIGIDGVGFKNVVLRSALSQILETISGGSFSEVDFVVQNGQITVATVDTLPTNLMTEMYDVADLLNPPANFQGGGNQGGGGGYGGGGGSYGGGGGGYGGGGGSYGGGGGGYGGGGGGSSYGGGGGGGYGGGGGGYGGGGGGGGGNWEARNRAFQLINTIQMTIEPETWYDEGGEGRIDQYSESKFIIYQTPDVHKQISELLDKLREDLGQQIAIETRFLLVTENFLQDIGLDVNIRHLKLGGGFGSIVVEQDSYSHVIPTDTGVPGSLAGAFTNPALNTAFSYESLDDLQVEFLLRATQSHSNAKQLQAPKVMVLNGESASLRVTTDKRLKTNSQFQSESVTSGTGVATSVYWWESENEDINTGVNLSITPVLTADKKFVILRINTFLTDLIAQDTETSIGFSPSGEQLEDTYILPTTQTASVQTRVAVPDRGTLMLGGLTITASREIESGAPVLSKIPGLGRLFSNRSTVDDKLMLLILVKPTILLQDEQEADAISALSRR